MTNYKPQERQDLEELYRKQNVIINELGEENRMLKEMWNNREEKIADLEIEIHNLKEKLEKCNEVSAIDFERVNEILQLRSKIQRLEFDVEAWHQLKLLLEWEIERLRWLQICWKTVAERIEDDKKVVRE